MKSKLPFLFLVLTQALFAQNFTEATQLIPFDGVVYSSIAFSDVNGDGSEDVLITGQNDPFAEELISKLYTNDGMGNYTEMTGTPFDGVLYSSIAFADVNGDGSEDVLITGAKVEFADQQISKLYINDGMGNFTEMTGTPFDGVWLGSIAFSDVNGDGSQDVLITGAKDAFGDELISKLYTNDGTGNFTEIMGTPFVGVKYSSIAFSDVNGDGSQDVLITGADSSFELISKLYTNDGVGNFTEITDTPFDDVYLGSIAFSDVNGDGTEDILITGQKEPFAGELISKLYTNDGMGNFTEVMGTPFDGVNSSSIAFSDVNGDGTEDVLITGQRNPFGLISKLYTNDGMGNFTEVVGTPFDGVRYSSVAFSDVNGDDSDDVLITGLNRSNVIISKLYINDGMVSSSDPLLVDVSLELTPFPNPVKSNNLNVSFKSTKSHSIAVRVYDLNGYLISHQKEFVGTGKQTLVVDITSLPTGTYFIQLENGKILGAAKFIVP
ncbi:MAG: T9SS type A sorting domain-containing protein [Bacteroidota bacterium]